MQRRGLGGAIKGVNRRGVVSPTAPPRRRCKSRLNAWNAPKPGVKNPNCSSQPNRRQTIRLSPRGHSKGKSTTRWRFRPYPARKAQRHRSDVTDRGVAVVAPRADRHHPDEPRVRRPRHRYRKAPRPRQENHRLTDTVNYVAMSIKPRRPCGDLSPAIIPVLSSECLLLLAALLTRVRHPNLPWSC